MTKNTKQLYTEVYKTDGHNYGEFTTNGTAMPKRAELHFNFIKQCLQKYNISENARVLEIGAAFGQLHTVHPNWEGLEYSNTAVTMAKKHYGTGLNIHEGDATALTHESNSIDFLFSFATLEHIPEVDKAFNEITRVLAIGGIAVLAPAWNCRPWTVKKLQQRPYSELTLAEKIGKFLIPLRNNLIFRMSVALPKRLWREAKYAFQKTPQPLDFKSLTPDFSLWEKYPHISDDDAFVDLDAHAALLYAHSKGLKCPSHPTKPHRILCRGEAIIIQKKA